MPAPPVVPGAGHGQPWLVMPGSDPAAPAVPAGLAPPIPAGLARRPMPTTKSPAANGSASAKPAPAPGSAANGSEPGDDQPRWVTKAIEPLLVVTCWLDPGDRDAGGDRGGDRDGDDGGEPLGATVRFSGQRTDVTGRSGPGDAFTQDEDYPGLLPGSGPVAVTAEVRGINAGTWAVTARPLPRNGTPAPKLAAPGRVPRPRRIPVPDGPATTLHTANLLRSRVPGINRFAYTPLCVIGVIVGLILESLLLSHAHYPLGGPIGLSLAAVAAGIIGGKTWYGAVHQWRKWDGWCIQGFVAAAAAVIAITAAAGPGLPAGAFLAATTPALLIGMGIGRHACFVAGCCTGRPTAWPGGIWSSDRRLGCRRMPVQLYEAWTALALGAAALATVLIAGLANSGPIAVITLAAYTLVRQFFLGLRSEPRAWRYGRRVTATVAALSLAAGAVLFAL